MRSIKTLRAAALALAAILLTGTALYAAETPAGDRHRAWESRLQQKLGLSEDQVVALRQIHASRDVNALKQHFKAVRAAQADLRRLALSGADDATLAAKQTEVQTLNAQSLQMRVATLKQVGQVLNPDQREAFAKMMDRGFRGHYHRHGPKGAEQQKG